MILFGVIVLSSLLALATSRVVPTSRHPHEPSQPPSFHTISFLPLNLTIPQLGGDDDPNPWEWKPPLPANNDQWQSAVCKGKTLIQAMRLPHDEAGQLFTPPRASAESEFNDSMPVGKTQHPFPIQVNL